MPTEAEPTDTYTITTQTPEPTETPETYTPIPPTAEPTPTPEPVYEIPVYANDSSAEDLDERAIARETMDYWEGEGAEYYPFDARFHFSSSRYNGGISIFLVDDVYEHVQQCGTSAIGCIVPRDSGTVEVYVEPCDERENTLSTVKHEFGHYLGLRHDDEPQPLMAPVTVDC